MGSFSLLRWARHEHSITSLTDKCHTAVYAMGMATEVGKHGNGVLDGARLSQNLSVVFNNRITA